MAIHVAETIKVLSLFFFVGALTVGCKESSGTTDDTTASTENTSEGTDSTGLPEECPDGSPSQDSGQGTLMEKWGAPCSSDADCKAIIDEDAVCVTNIVDAFEAPGGYCSKNCSLPDENTKYVENATDCNGEATCLGVDGFFEACAVPCEDDSQCDRNYICRTMPIVGEAGDPKFCLMVDACQIGDAPPPA